MVTNTVKDDFVLTFEAVWQNGGPVHQVRAIATNLASKATAETQLSLDQIRKILEHAFNGPRNIAKISLVARGLTKGYPAAMIHTVLALIILASSAFPVAAVSQISPVPVPHHDPNFESERKQADELFLTQKPLEALPLYEDLCRQDPTIAVFAERHAAGLLAKQATLSDPTVLGRRALPCRRP